MSQTGLAPEGLLLVHKPPGVTSHDVVDAARRILRLRRIGHTGTLDPIAEGLLILLVGAATRHQRTFQGHDKTYEGALRLGVRTDTGDAAGATIEEAPIPPVDPARLAEVIAGFRGAVSQTPPAYSAVKVRGRPAYWWTRRRQPVTLAPRTVQIYEFDLLGQEGDLVMFRIRCSAGTYVRTLAEAVAERLGTVGHLDRLVRIAIGRWMLGDAVTLDWIRSASPEVLCARLQPVRHEDLAGAVHAR